MVSCFSLMISRLSVLVWCRLSCLQAIVTVKFALNIMILLIRCQKGHKRCNTLHFNSFQTFPWRCWMAHISTSIWYEHSIGLSKTKLLWLLKKQLPLGPLQYKFRKCEIKAVQKLPRYGELCTCWLSDYLIICT